MAKKTSKPRIASHFDMAKILGQVESAIKAAESTGNPAVVAATQKALIDRADETTRPIIEALFTKAPQVVKTFADDPIVGDRAIREATELVRNTREYEMEQLQKKNLRLIASARRQVNAIPKTRAVTVNANDLYGAYVISSKGKTFVVPREGTVTIQEDLTGARNALKAKQIAEADALKAADASLRAKIKAAKDAKGLKLQQASRRRLKQAIAQEADDIAWRQGLRGGVKTSIRPKGIKPLLPAAAAAGAAEQAGAAALADQALKAGGKAAAKGLLGRAGSFLFGPWGTAIAAGLTAKELLLDPVLEGERQDRMNAVDAILQGRDAMDFAEEEYRQTSLQRDIGRLQVAEEAAALNDAAAIAQISGLMSPEEKSLLANTGVAYQPAPWEIYNRMSQ